MLEPLPPSRWSPEAAAHLLNRAGFGGSPDDIAALHARGFEAAISALVDVPAPESPEPVPDWAKPGETFALRRELRAMDEEKRRMRLMEKRKEDQKHLIAIRGEWLERMRSGPDPLREKMTLFWHGHFSVSAEQVRSPYLLWQQNCTLRAHGLGQFGALTKTVARDPAMLIYLDTVQSRPGRPNENFARELMELFTLGEGHYSEADIRESARAFVGYRIDPATESFRLVRMQQDSGTKSFLGKTGLLDGDGVIDRILEQPECARFIARKIWVFLAGENPSEPLVEALATDFRRSGYSIRPLLRRILQSAEFYAPANIRSQIKSPAQWMVQTARSLEMPLPPALFAANAMRQMGQLLFAPPSVKGWDGGRAWISTSTLLIRYNLANALLRGDVSGLVPDGRPALRRAARARLRGPVLDLIAPPALRPDPIRLVDALAWRLFQSAPDERERRAFLDYLKARPAPPADDTLVGLAHLMMSTPQFQLC